MVAMQQVFREPPVQWLTASPLWVEDEAERDFFRRPAILRFANDTFMEEFLTVATTTPEQLGKWRVQKETWRIPATTPLVEANIGQSLLEDQPLKLYQAGHQRFYLVTANLVCRIPGLPDKMLDLSQGEQVSFVLRRKMEDASDETLKEHALVNGGWQPLEKDQEQQLLAGEQQFPLFPVTYQEFSDHRRRMFAGLVPVSGREAYMTAGRRPVTENGNNAVISSEERLEQMLTVLDMDVLEPWNNIEQSWAQEDSNIIDSWSEVSGSSSDRNLLGESVKKAFNKLQSASWYVLLDFAYFLEQYLEDVWAVIDRPNPDASVPAGTLGKALIEALQAMTFKSQTSTDYSTDSRDTFRDKLRGRNETGGTSMARALKDAFAARVHLETTAANYVEESDADWPASQFLLCGQRVLNQKDSIRTKVALALEEAPPDPTTPIPLMPMAKAITETTSETDYENDMFTIRCVYQRPNCPPSIRPTVVSQETEWFQMASYFDPEAPARPIRIPMPVDTTPAGLRKFAKNTMFVVSDTLACQIDKARSLTFGDLVLSVLPWPFHKNLPDTLDDECENVSLNIGQICTLSIPIITICALILLIIIVFLLDVIFKWVPYLIFCLPLPGLKAKKD